MYVHPGPWRLEQQRRGFTMSAQFIKVLVPPPVGAPRGAEWASALVTRMVQVGATVWRSLENFGQARANHELQEPSVPYAHWPRLDPTVRTDQP